MKFTGQTDKIHCRPGKVITVFVWVSRLENPPNSLFLDTMDFLTMDVVAIVLLRAPPRVNGRRKSFADTILAFVKTSRKMNEIFWLKQFWGDTFLEFQFHVKHKNCFHLCKYWFVELNCKQLSCCNFLGWVRNLQISGGLKIGGGQKQATAVILNTDNIGFCKLAPASFLLCLN